MDIGFLCYSLYFSRSLKNSKWKGFLEIQILSLISNLISGKLFNYSESQFLDLQMREMLTL